ncbi:MAG: type 4a pilus biogenesis protein PilO [Candidatus Omnitrophica bacterium]|nr:type 4a pilus biogenesis protein PilO [Candidatus Omnitrophota bacterium]
MPKIDFKNLSGGKLLKSKREIYLLSIFLLIIFFRLIFPQDIKRLKSIRDENLKQQEELNRKKTEFFSVEGLLKDKERYEEEYNQMLKTAETLDKEIARLKNALVDKENLTEVLNQFTTTVNPEEIEFSLITMGPMVEYENYNELPVKMKINANYLHFLDYIRRLETLPFLTEIKKLHISSLEHNGTVNVETELAVYVGK